MKTLEEWRKIETAPKDDYLIGYDPGLKRPFIMLWNVPAQRFIALDGYGDETPSHWMQIPPIPKDEPGICPHCNGSGEGQHEGSRCNYCKGMGEL